MRPPKRCPFCGDRPTVSVVAETTVISCDNELCDVQPCASDKDETKALQKWNRRAE
jgi:hypothetical protein